jgi:hypothetical protein
MGLPTQIESTAMIYSIRSATAAVPSPQVESRVLSRYLLVAEPGTAWPALAERWREHGAEISVLLQHTGEAEPAFSRRLCTTIARAELHGMSFDGAALIANDAAGPGADAARMRLVQLLAQTLLRSARPITLYLGCEVSAPAPVRRCIERIQRTVAREFRDLPLFTLRTGLPDAALPFAVAPARAAG